MIKWFPILNIVPHVWGIPLNDRNLVFEDRLYELVSNLLKESEPEVQQIVSELSDAQVIYKKGEGPEVVFKQGDQLIPQHGVILMLKYFIAKRIVLVRRLVGLDEVAQSSFLDVGTTSGLFLRYLGKQMMGINISPRAVENTLKHGVQSIVGSIEALPFPDKYFDYILSFQTLEHVENPVMALQELARVCRKRAYITIPYTDVTKICSFDNVDTLNPTPLDKHRWHVFEFCRDDFHRIITRTGFFRVTYEEMIRVIGSPKTARQWIFSSLYGRLEWLKGFQFYELAPDV